jgi:hypothetical protein
MLALAVVAALAAGAVPASASDAPTEYQVKAAFLYKFVQFVEWPREAPAAPVAMGILGADPFDDALDAIVAGKSLRGRRFVVRRFDSVAAVDACQVLFIAPTEARRLPQILDALGDAPILTVADMEEFAERGGMIGFVREGRHVRFEINIAAAERCGLRISSQLLKVARIVTTRTE